MPIYSYTALKQGKEVVKGEITASNIKDARDVVRKMGLVPTQITEFTDAKLKKANHIDTLSLNEKIDFISTLQILLTSGIPAVESLMFMEQEAAKPKIRSMSKVLKTQIMSGSTLADTLARYPQVFGYIFIGLIKAGEEAGELEKTLGRIQDLLTKQANTKSKVIGTLMYPVFVIVLAFIITLVMLLFVFPAFKDMFEQQEKALPWITQMMINAGDYLKTYWFTIPLFIILSKEASKFISLLKNKSQTSQSSLVTAFIILISFIFVTPILNLFNNYYTLSWKVLAITSS